MTQTNFVLASFSSTGEVVLSWWASNWFDNAKWRNIENKIEFEKQAI